MTDTNTPKLSKALLWDYFILIARIWLAIILMQYGYSKIIDGQFGVTDATMELKLKDVGLFNLSWYLADHEPFKSFVGIAQLITAALLIYNRTVILGAFMAIPLWLNILVWDMTFMGLYTPFTIRLPFYLLLTFLILWHHRDKVIPALRNFITTTTRFQYPWWAYLLLPVFGAILEMIGAIPIGIIHFIKQGLR
ncbi:DoxX family membrane protein [Pedobacter frigoris]|uniref:DoxX family membrane protein n=1 Tax=Pedobacter frigoris TaxID=2571272 RepID=UPI00292E9C46|nr:DoxX family membrane protein [Pedobacter frigoris]